MLRDLLAEQREGLLKAAADPDQPLVVPLQCSGEGIHVLLQVHLFSGLLPFASPVAWRS